LTDEFMSDDKYTVPKWLGGVYGEKMIGLPLTVINTLTEASLDDTLLDDKMIPSLGEELTANKKLVWRGIFEHMATVDPDRRVSDLDINKFMVWLQAVSTPAKMTPKKETLGMSATALADLSNQGAGDLEDLAWFELSVFTGRPVSRADVVGWEYGAPPNMCEGAKVARKAAMETFDTLMARAKLEGSVIAMDQWITKLSTTMLTCGHPFAPFAASRLMEWWMSTRTTNVTTRKITAYVAAYRKHYMGRGFPTVFDAQIQATILSAGEETERCALPAALAPKRVAESQQMSELGEAMKALAAMAAATQTELVEMRRGRANETICYNCGGAGHHAYACKEPKREARK
jgi:hypothetical protein